MVNKQFFPSIMNYIAFLSKSINELNANSLASGAKSIFTEKLNSVSELFVSASSKLKVLEEEREKAYKEVKDVQAFAYKEKVVPVMAELRKDIDDIEKICPKEYWPIPTYADLLFDN